jgi:selenocysteine-specific elongation factor
MARVRLLGSEALLPGQAGWVQLELREPLALVEGDRYIVRLPSPPTTVGGGIVVDPNPGRKHRRFRPEVVDRLETLAEGSPAAVLLQTLEREGPMIARDLLRVSRLGADASDALIELLDENQVIFLAEKEDQGPPSKEEMASSRRWVVSVDWWSELIDRAVNELSTYHESHPLRTGMPREALRSSLHLRPQVFDAAMMQASIEGKIVDEAATVRLSSHAVRFTPDQKQRVEALLARFHNQPYAPPSVKESTDLVSEEVLSVLLNRGELVKVSPDVLFLSETYEEMVRRIEERIQRHGSVTLAGVRDMFDSSRKDVQALLEHLDEVGVTKRVGDKRVLR